MPYVVSMIIIVLFLYQLRRYRKENLKKEMLLFCVFAALSLGFSILFDGKNAFSIVSFITKCFLAFF